MQSDVLVVNVPLEEHDRLCKATWLPKALVNLGENQSCSLDEKHSPPDEQIQLPT